MRRLLVIIPDQLTQIIDKGELQPLYYNPGELFDEVHILMTNADTPPVEPLQYTVGRARLILHNYPDDLTLPQKPFPFLDEFRLRRWAEKGVELARAIQPDMIRCHGADWNAYLASRIKRKLGIPYCVSLHTSQDVRPTRQYLDAKTPQEYRHNAFYRFLERQVLTYADYVLPVYKSILPYLKRHKISDERIKISYNILNFLHLKKKDGYSSHQPFSFICVGRLIEGKNPANIICALVELPKACLTIVGDGPLRPELEALVRSLGLEGRVMFRPSVMNDELCALLAEQDAFVVHTEYSELNKSVLEALLTGLPVIINRRKGEQVPEFSEGDFVRFVDNTPEAYHAAMRELMDKPDAREDLGRRAYAHARARWAPEITEAAYVAVYKELLERNSRG